MTEYAHFVGRIGGLAAALGVGIALTVGVGTPAVVNADTGSESSPANNSSDTSSSSETSGTNSPAGATSRSERSRELGSSATATPGTTVTPRGATELPDSKPPTASAFSGTRTPPIQPGTTSNGESPETDPPTTPEDEPPTTDDQQIATEATESISAPTTPTDAPPTPGDTTATPSPDGVTATDPPSSVTKNTNATRNSRATAAPLVQATAKPVTAPTERTITALTPALSSVSSRPTTSLSAATVAAKNTPLTATTNQVATQFAAATASTPTPTLIDAVVTTIDRLLRNTVTAAMGITGSGAPVDNPLAWTILAWTRRIVFNEPNNAPTPAAVSATATAVEPEDFTVDISSPNASGAVTVNIDAADRFGPVTYSVKKAAKPATGSVTTDSTPGVFTYTPTTAARASAAGGPMTDTFTIAVTPTANPNKEIATVTIKAPVKPATIAIEVKAETTMTSSVVSTGTITSVKTDPSGIPVAYRVEATDLPKYGKVHIDPTANPNVFTWTYTPNIKAVKEAHIASLVFFNGFVDKTAEIANLPDPAIFKPAKIALDTGNWWQWEDEDGDGEWKEEVNRPPRFDTFTITAYDPNNPSVRYDSVPVYADFARLPLHLSYDFERSNRVYVFPDGYKWIYGATAPVDDNGKVSGSKFDIDPTTGKFTYTPNASVFGRTEYVTITATADGTDHPTITCEPKDYCAGELEISVTSDGEWFVTNFKKSFGGSDAVEDHASVGNSTRTVALGASDYKIGTGFAARRDTCDGPARGWWILDTCALPIATAPPPETPAPVEQPIDTSLDNPRAGSPQPTPAAANGPINEPTANSDPSGAHAQTPLFDFFGWLFGIDVNQLLPQSADPGSPLVPTLDPLNPAAPAEGQPVDILALLDSVLGLNPDNNLPGSADPTAPVNIPLDARLPTPGTP